MENKAKLSVVIDGKVYMLSGGSSETYMQKIASYVDNKIRELKSVNGYQKLSPDYRNILLALNLAEELFKVQDEKDVSSREYREKEEEIYRLKQDLVEKDMRIETANRLVIEYKTKVNELQKRIIELETRHELS
ncbi:MAG: cell division protein ZapA [Eubacteriales bacterium]|nr:cell division protein ZapA [Eubacteriales bacterium]